MKVDRLFLDANVLISAAITPEGTAARLCGLTRVRLLGSPHVLEEARRNVRAADAAARLEALIAAMTVLPTEPADFEIDGDPRLPAKDRPVLLGAIVTQAHFLITGDIAHFGPYMGMTVHGVRILTPGQYVRSL